MKTPQSINKKMFIILVLMIIGTYMADIPIKTAETRFLGFPSRTGVSAPVDTNIKPLYTMQSQTAQTRLTDNTRQQEQTLQPRFTREATKAQLPSRETFTSQA